MVVDHLLYFRKYGWERFGFGYARETTSNYARSAVVVSHWFLVVGFAVLPAGYALLWQRGRRFASAKSAGAPM